MGSPGPKVAASEIIGGVAYLAGYAEIAEVKEAGWETAFDLGRFCTVAQY